MAPPWGPLAFLPGGAAGIWPADIHIRQGASLLLPKNQSPHRILGGEDQPIRYQPEEARAALEAGLERLEITPLPKTTLQ